MARLRFYFIFQLQINKSAKASNICLTTSVFFLFESNIAIDRISKTWKEIRKKGKTVPKRTFAWKPL